MAGKIPEHHHRFNFNPDEPVLAIAAVIAKHTGEAAAISIEGIAIEVFGFEWGCVQPGAKGWPEWPHRPNIQRAIKSAVRKLRRRGVKIGSCRGSKTSPPGYYMISTAAELAKTVRPMLAQAVDELRTVEVLTGRGFYTSELEGQQRLFSLD